MSDICQTCKGTRKITLFTSEEDCLDCSGIQVEELDWSKDQFEDYYQGWEKLCDFILGGFGIDKARMSQMQKAVYPDANLSFLEEE